MLPMRRQHVPGFALLAAVRVLLNRIWRDGGFLWWMTGPAAVALRLRHFWVRARDPAPEVQR